MILGMLISYAWLLVPGLMSQMFVVMCLFVTSVSLYSINWANAGLFYVGLIPGLSGFVFLYFWLISYAYFKLLKTETKQKKANVRPMTESL